MSTAIETPETQTLPAIERTRHVPKPGGAREPLKVSVYERMSKSSAQLMPIFPYDGAGAIVPCGAMLYSGPDKSHGHFFHWNTVSELLVAWGCSEGMIPTGSLMATQPFHGVNSFLRDEKAEGSYMLATITQRQSSEAGQREALSAKCEKCKQEIVRFEYPAAPEGAPDHDPTAHGGYDGDTVPQFSTMWGSQEFVRLRNADENRICKNCGHENYVFNQTPWGWNVLFDKTTIANDAYRSLEAAAKKALS